MDKKPRILFSALIIIALVGMLSSAAMPLDRNFQISRNYNIFSSIFRELSEFYVDSTDVDAAFGNAIDGLLSDYDPYTEYIPEEEMTDFKYITTGEYGGIGALIGRRGDKIHVTEPYEGLPAQKAGVQFGDEIVEIDGEKMEGQDVSYASSKLRGQPGTELVLLLRREGQKKLLKVKIRRELIVIDQVQYAGMVDAETGYIYLNSFTDKAAEEVRRAAEQLKARGATRLILDLRGNGGGLLTEAVSICNLFVAKGEIIVSTRGRVPTWDRIYRTMRQPLDTQMPLVVLTNNGSASSSEIVAGALQDLDRAVIVGSRTYGKGLVQTTREVAYNGILKVTTAKYYIPSGRCIQAIDYANRNADGSVGRIPDSLTTVFSTRHGRQVRDGGGILPDVEVKVPELSNLSVQLVIDNHIFDYANLYAREHGAIAPAREFRLSEQDYRSFKEFVIKRGVNYDLRSRQEMKTLKRVLEYEGFMQTASEEFAALEKKIGKDLAHDLDQFRPEIEKLLRQEIILRYYYQRGQLEASLVDDEAVTEAVKILSDSARYQSILHLGD